MADRIEVCCPYCGGSQRRRDAQGEYVCWHCDGNGTVLAPAALPVVEEAANAAEMVRAAGYVHPAEVIEAQAAEIERLRQLHSWRPMASAPKDGRRFLAAVDGEARIVAWGKTSHVPIVGWCLAGQGAEDFDLCQPAGWMPLPVAPPGGADLGER